MKFHFARGNLLTWRAFKITRKAARIGKFWVEW